MRRVKKAVASKAWVILSVVYPLSWVHRLYPSSLLIVLLLGVASAIGLSLSLIYARDMKKAMELINS